jgi:uncharacterized membrane protein YfcA
MSGCAMSRFSKCCGGVVGALVCSRILGCLALFLGVFRLRVRTVLEGCRFSAREVEEGRLLRWVWAFRLLLVWSFGSGWSRFGFGVGFGFVCAMMVAVEEVSSLVEELLVVAQVAV